MMPDMIRNDAMYCATRFSITRHPASTTIGREERGEQDEQHRNAVHAEVIVDVEARDPVVHLDELHLRGVAHETGIQRDRHQKTQHRADQRQHARQRRILVVAGGQHQDAEQDRQPDRDANYR